MTVAVTVNLSDGVVFGVDSMVTLPSSAGKETTVYDNSEKLFPLGKLPIGIATYGLGAMGSRSIGSYLREYEVTDPDGLIATRHTMADVVESLRRFLMAHYHRAVTPALEAYRSMPFGEIPAPERPAFGVIVGGFASGAYLSEVWEVLIPEQAQPGTARLRRPQGQFGADAYAMPRPIERYLDGIDWDVLQEIIAYFESLREVPLTPDELAELFRRVSKHHYYIPYYVMPIEEGVRLTRFLVELVINHYRFAPGHPIVGGQVRLGKVTYRDEGFQLLDR